MRQYNENSEMRNFTTSLEYGVAHNTAKSTSLDNLPAKRKVNLGLSIIINLEKLEEEESLFEDFFFSHINLIECHMHKLKQIVTDAYFQGKNFIDNIYKGFEILKTLQDLYAAPRLQFPMWLTIMTSVDDLQTKYSQLVEEFVSLLEDFDTKNTNFFCINFADSSSYISFILGVNSSSFKSLFSSKFSSEEQI
ncbi:folliculin-interacting protein 2-like [Centruroides sculpturatus]|uniref:folliculin-interacting protein 2-like n=1 Tax=Centruroides sculpturatus TaxID=218467 RepID=UPI000C6ED7EB|nr:folliculin-interacting protein 2-like [Centruroides sculpturatus]